MCEFPEYDVNEIVPGLWLGNLASAYDKGFLNNYKIKHVLTLYEAFDQRYRYPWINYLTYKIRDKHMQGINMIDFFDKTSDYINYILKKNEPILIHCKKGHHRSGAVVAAFLIKHYNMDYENTVRYINNLRPCALRRDKWMSKELFRYNLHLKNIKGCNMQCKKYYRDGGKSHYNCHCD